MLLQSLRAGDRGRRRTRIFVALTAAIAGSVLAVACGIEAVATKEYPALPDSAEATAEVSLPPKPDAPFEDADAGEGSANGCPAGRGPMVKVSAGGLVFCIDATEVTNVEYDKFVAATGGTVEAGAAVFEAGAPADCVFNAGYARGGGTVADPATLPAVRIDWCDAHDYCRWAGKRLCAGHVAGDASTGEWSAACTNGGTQPYPYGATFQKGACNDDASAPVAVKATAACQGGVPGLYDMNGNVSEWVDNCSGLNCNTMGGYYLTVLPTGCATVYDYARNLTDPTIGFRCCADAR